MIVYVFTKLIVTFLNYRSWISKELLKKLVGDLFEIVKRSHELSPTNLIKRSEKKMKIFDFFKDIVFLIQIVGSEKGIKKN